MLPLTMTKRLAKMSQLKKKGDNSTEYMVEKLTRDSTDSMIVHALNLCSDISEAKGNTSDFSRFVRIRGTGNTMYELIM